MFIDKARIYVEAGKGGDGASSFRREKFVERGGPDGGNGGHGGHVILKADSNLNTLVDFRYKRKFVADKGVNGGGAKCTGARAENIIIPVPVGTVVKDDSEEFVLADLVEDGQEFVAAKGGRGGKGNACYVTSTNRAPTFSEKGEPGTLGWMRLELKLLADVGLVGYPSVGKSSIISRVSAAKPEVAAYHFTTLTPVLGVVRLGDDQSMVLADIPGIIEGASEGVGLGLSFLRHIERTKVLLHVVDVSGCEGRDPIEDFEKINAELVAYSGKLAKRRQLVVANKMDLPDSADNYEIFKDYIEEKGLEIMPVSAATGEGLKELMWKAWHMLQDYVPDEDDMIVVDTPEEEDPDKFIITRDCEDADFEVKGTNIERLIAMTNFDNPEALYRFQLIWKRLKIEEALQKAGIKEGQTVRILDMVFNYKKSKWE